VLGIDIEHDEIRYLAGDDSNVGIRPPAEPIDDLLYGRGRTLQSLPAYERALAEGAQRQDAPSAGQITLRLFGKPCHRIYLR
jgi:hypothetical protein